MDMVACRASRQLYCSESLDVSDPRAIDLCHCYLPSRMYVSITNSAIADLALASADQLNSIRDIISNNILTPSCWYESCVTSTYGVDTELVVPCQSIGLCIQNVDTSGTTLDVKGRVSLGNSCTIEAHVTAGLLM